MAFTAAKRRQALVSDVELLPVFLASGRRTSVRSIVRRCAPSVEVGTARVYDRHLSLSGVLASVHDRQNRRGQVSHPFAYHRARPSKAINEDHKKSLTSARTALLDGISYKVLLRVSLDELRTSSELQSDRPEKCLSESDDLDRRPPPQGVGRGLQHPT